MNTIFEYEWFLCKWIIEDTNGQREKNKKERRYDSISIRIHTNWFTAITKWKIKVEPFHFQHFVFYSFWVALRGGRRSPNSVVLFGNFIWWNRMQSDGLSLIFINSFSIDVNYLFFFFLFLRFRQNINVHVWVFVVYLTIIKR